MFKKIILFAFLITAGLTASLAQSPNLINYQGVAHQANGSAISNQNITVRFSIHHATSNGIIQYSETRTLSTDADGLFNLQIGSAGATSTVGSWSAITWDNGVKYLQVEMDANGGTSFVNLGTQQLVSVPYAQFANKAGSLMPSATINPNQINASGATLNQVLKFDGTTWVPSTLASSGSFVLPYSGTDTNANSLTIVNSNSVNGTAIRGTSAGSANTSAGVSGTASGIIGAGVSGSSTGSFGIGVSGTSNSPNGNGVKGSSTDGVGVKGVSTNGTAIIGNSTNGIAINGASVNNTGIFGSTSGNNKVGVYGVTSGNNGSGVEGYASNPTSVGVKAIHTSSGTALYGSSGTGYAIETNGNVKLGGTNMNPSDGAVLTSDASGNAKWQNNKVAFGAHGIALGYSSLPEFYYKKVEFSVEDFDLTGSFIPSESASNPNASEFQVPVSGIYNLNAQIMVYLFGNTDLLQSTQLRIQLNRGGATTQLFTTDGFINEFMPTFDKSGLALNTEFHLLAGDKIWLEVKQDNSGSASANIGNTFSFDNCWFRGHLVFAD